jgi:hypothetical protein
MRHRVTATLLLLALPLLSLCADGAALSPAAAVIGATAADHPPLRIAHSTLSQMLIDTISPYIRKQPVHDEKVSGLESHAALERVQQEKQAKMAQQQKEKQQQPTAATKDRVPLARYGHTRKQKEERAQQRAELAKIRAEQDRVRLEQQQQQKEMQHKATEQKSPQADKAVKSNLAEHESMHADFLTAQHGECSAAHPQLTQ